MSWAVRTYSSTSGTVVPAIRQVLTSVAPELPFIRFETMHALIAHDLRTERFLMILLGVFAATAMTLAATGMYGLTAYTVSQRTKEVGIRMAVGASSGRVLRAFLAEGVTLALVGLTIGVGAAMFLGQLLASLVFNITPRDPLTILAVSAALLTVIGLATMLPALQASRIDPVRALRLD
jgi:ABC-type antimicrobial peptide transport system permease subunit